MTRIRFYGSGPEPNLSRAKRPPGERGDTRPTDARVKGGRETGQVEAQSFAMRCYAAPAFGSR